jgi:hypothetical protein
MATPQAQSQDAGASPVEQQTGLRTDGKAQALVDAVGRAHEARAVAEADLILIGAEVDLRFDPARQRGLGCGRHQMQALGAHRQGHAGADRHVAARLRRQRMPGRPGEPGHAVLDLRHRALDEVGLADEVGDEAIARRS